jgi:hypothetical protein
MVVSVKADQAQLKGIDSLVFLVGTGSFGNEQQYYDNDNGGTSLGQSQKLEMKEGSDVVTGLGTVWYP